MTYSRLLSTIFIIDALISVGFGLVSLLAPEATFATLVDLSGAEDESLILATLASISLFYMLIGLVCFVAAPMQPPYIDWLAAVMIIRHGWMGTKGYLEIGRAWLIGDPWPDIFIRTAFVIAYLGLLLLRRQRQN
ncbi:hypothetical protein KFU94_45995 [Chloroflexi bacterium TSY]|nr:hypothetical protein [Chloroflexi bacterium TSY]